MKLVCSKPQLVDIINTVQRAIAPKTSLPILECIKIDGKVISECIDKPYFINTYRMYCRWITLDNPNLIFY